MVEGCPQLSWAYVADKWGCRAELADAFYQPELGILRHSKAS